jgi:hypothetical protein
LDLFGEATKLLFNFYLLNTLFHFILHRKIYYRYLNVLCFFPQKILYSLKILFVLYQFNTCPSYYTFTDTTLIKLMNIFSDYTETFTNYKMLNQPSKINAWGILFSLHKWNASPHHYFLVFAQSAMLCMA